MRFAEPEIAGLTELAVARLLRGAEAGRSISLLEGGHLVLDVDPAMLVRVDAAALIGDGLRIRRLPRRGPGGVELGPGPLALVDGQGTVVFARGPGAFYITRLRRDRCYLREDALWAAEPSLHWELGALPGTRHDDAPEGALFARVAGDGVLALRTQGDLLAVKVAPGRSQRVDPGALLGWIGDIVAIGEPELRQLRCEGEGALLIDLRRDGAAATDEGKRP